MFDLNSMMGKIKEAQENMKKTQEEMGKITETAESGGGMVKATVNGQKELIKLDIDADIISKEDKQLIEDLCVAAVNLALKKIEEKTKDMMQNSLLQGMPNIPGLDLSNLKF
jgi:nucleoid-associated protein EbfC